METGGTGGKCVVGSHVNSLSHEASIQICLPCLPCLPLPFFSKAYKREAENIILPYGRIELLVDVRLAVVLPGKVHGRLDQDDVTVENAAILHPLDAVVL